jgi:hypothetical protein
MSEAFVNLLQAFVILDGIGEGYRKSESVASEFLSQVF